MSPKLHIGHKFWFVPDFPSMAEIISIQFCSGVVDVHGLLKCAGLALTMLQAAASQAAVMTYTFTGTVDSSYDQTGIFGTAGGSFDGIPYVSVYTVDTTLGIRNLIPGSDTVSGGTYFGATNPITSAYITLGGKTFDMLAQYYGLAVADGGYFIQSYQDDDSFPAIRTANALYNIAYFDYFPTDLEFSMPQRAVDGYGQFQLLTFDPATSETFVNTYAWLNTQTMSVTVPEPASWALMIVGFGLVGATLRRRQAVSA